MEFYTAGGAGLFLGFALRMVGSTKGWFAAPKRRKNRLDVVLIVIAVSVWIFSPLLFALVFDIFFYLDLLAALWFAWLGCLVCTFLLGFGLGWLLGYDKSPRANLPNPYADNSPNPFGSDTSLSHTDGFPLMDGTEERSVSEGEKLSPDAAKKA